MKCIWIIFDKIAYVDELIYLNCENQKCDRMEEKWVKILDLVVEISEAVNPSFMKLKIIEIWFLLFSFRQRKGGKSSLCWKQIYLYPLWKRWLFNCIFFNYSAIKNNYIFGMLSCSWLKQNLSLSISLTFTRRWVYLLAQI